MPSSSSDWRTVTTVGKSKLTEDAAALKRRAEEWATERVDALRDAWHELPDELTDRQQDAAEPLLAIAEMAGDAWAGSISRGFASSGGGI
jgi:hypothetical protein